MHNLWIHISASKFNLKKFLGWLTSISMKVVISWKRWVQALGKEKQEVHLILFFKDSILKCCLLFIHLCVCFCLFIWLCGMQDLSSSTRDRTCTPCIPELEAQRQVPSSLILNAWFKCSFNRVHSLYFSVSLKSFVIKKSNFTVFLEVLSIELHDWFGSFWGLSSFVANIV